MKRLAVLWSLLAVGVLSAADWPKGNARKHAFLNVALSNKTTEEVDQAKVCFGEYQCNAGVLGLGGTKTHVGWERPITTNAIVQWKDARGANQEQTVNLIGIYEPKFDGVLTFTIGNTNVTAAFKRIERK